MFAIDDIMVSVKMPTIKFSIRPDTCSTKIMLIISLEYTPESHKSYFA